LRNASHKKGTPCSCAFFIKEEIPLAKQFFHLYPVRKPHRSCLPRPRSGPGSAERYAGDGGNRKYQLLIEGGSKPWLF